MMINLNFKKQFLVFILFMIIILSIFSLTVKSAPILDNLSQNKKIAVVIKENKLLLVTLAGNNITELDTDGTFSRPRISPDKNYVAYLKNGSLWITTLNGKKLKIANKVSKLSFSWIGNSTLIYSPEDKGLYAYHTGNGITEAYLKNSCNYQNITWNNSNYLYVEKYCTYKQGEFQNTKDFGVVLFNLKTKEEKLIIKSIPSSLESDEKLGMYPIIAGISKDNKFLYIWKHPHSASIAADGVELATYDAKRNTLIEYNNPDLISLAYSDNISSNPKNNKYLALIKGLGREMSSNKTLILLNILNGSYKNLTPPNVAAMTPYYSKNGKTILYSSSKNQQNEGINQWILNGNHYIYSINTDTNQVRQLTNNPNTFDFAPQYINSKDVIFFRNDKSSKISMWKLSEGKEVMLIDDLIFYDDKEFPIQNYYGHFNNELFTDIQ